MLTFQKVFDNPLSKFQGCHDVSVPVEPTHKQIVSQLKEKIVDGTYNIGQLIVAQSYEKNVLINDKLVKETTTTEGRNMDLLDIYKKKHA